MNGAQSRDHRAKILTFIHHFTIKKIIVPIYKKKCTSLQKELYLSTKSSASCVHMRSIGSKVSERWVPSILLVVVLDKLINLNKFMSLSSQFSLLLSLSHSTKNLKAFNIKSQRSAQVQSKNTPSSLELFSSCSCIFFSGV